MSDEVEAAAVEAEVDMENPETPAEGETPTKEEKKEEKEGGGGGGGGSADFSTAGLLIRLMQLTFAVIAFAVMASANNFDRAASFNLIVATGVIITVWVLVAMGMECGKSSALSKIEIFMDFLLSELALASFCAAGATQSKLNSTIYAVDASRVRCLRDDSRRVDIRTHTHTHTLGRCAPSPPPEPSSTTHTHTPLFLSLFVCDRRAWCTARAHKCIRVSVWVAYSHLFSHFGCFRARDDQPTRSKLERIYTHTYIDMQ